MTCIDNIAGYMTERAVWQLIGFAAGCDCRADDITPGNIAVDNATFSIIQRHAPSAHADAPDKARAIGSLAFYALMGTHAFGAEGQQPASAEVPYISSAHCSRALSTLLHRCLSFDPARRPTLSEINSAAAANANREYKPKKRIATRQGKSYRTSIVGFWPEEMAVAILSLALSFLAPVTAAAQTDVPKEMATIISRCRQLRSPGNANKVSREFLYDTEWTLMDEIDIDRKGECTTKDKVSMFGINDMGYRIAKRQGGVANTGGRFRNGQDERYRFSLIEITAKKGCTVSYEITGRKGLQQFAVIPYDRKAAFSVSVGKNGKPFGRSAMKDDVCHVQLSQRVAKTDRFRISIKNSSGRNMAFIIVNYNPGK